MGRRRNRHRRPTASVATRHQLVIPEAAPEVAAERDARLAAVLELLDERDLDALLRGSTLAQRQALASAFGLRVDPRFVQGGLGKLLRTRIPSVPPAERLDSTAPLMSGASQIAERCLGEERYSHPTRDDLTEMVDVLLGHFPVGAVRLFLAHNAARNCSAAGLLDDLLTTDARLSLPAPPAVEEAARPDPEDDPDAEPEVQVQLFTALDNLLIRTIVRTIMGAALAPEPEELRRMVLEFVTLNTDRYSSYFHLGLLGALFDDPPRPPVSGMNAERWRWFRFGRLLGFVRRGSGAPLLAAVRERIDETEQILAHPAMARDLFAPVLREVLPVDPAMAARWLSRVHPAVLARNPSILPLAQERARQLLAEGRQTDAELLLHAVEPWSDNDDSPGSPPWTPTWVDVRCDLVACRRAANDFAGAAALLEDLDQEQMAPQSRPIVAVERGLVAGRFGHLTHVRFPGTGDDGLHMAQRLTAGRVHFEEALAGAPGNAVAAYCLGVLAVVEGRPGEAAALLERVDAASERDPVLASLAGAVRFHRALAALRTLQPGVDGPALKALSDAIDGGYEPPPGELLEVCAALQAMGSRHAGTFVARVTGLPASAAALAPVAAELAREADRHGVEAAETLGNAGRLTAASRFDCLAAALTGAAVLGDRARVETLADALDDLVAGACDVALDAAWERLLAGDGHLRPVLGPVAAELARVSVLRRLGRTGAARGVLEGLFWRALNRELDPYAPEDILALLEEAGADGDTLRDLSAHLEGGPGRAGDSDGAVDVLATTRPVRLVFVGGNETQHQWQPFIDDEVLSRSGGLVRVAWSGGFSPDWSKILRRAKCDLDSADALVLMPYVRTNLGRHLRREASERNLPWIPCTGTGRGSLLRAIERAVEVVEAEAVVGR